MKNQLSRISKTHECFTYERTFSLRLVTNYRGRPFTAAEARNTFHVCCVPRESRKTAHTWADILLNVMIMEGVIQSLGHNTFRSLKKQLSTFQDDLVDFQAESNGYGN